MDISMKIGKRKCACISLGIVLITPSSASRLEAQSKSTPDNVQVMKLMQLGSDAMHQGKSADAEQYFSQATVAAPQFADAYLGLGLAQMRENKSLDADASLGKAIELNPRLPGAHMFFGIANYQLAKFDEASKALREEIVLQPENTEALTWLGIVELGSGRPDLAAGPLDQAAAIRPNDPNILYYRGRAHTLIAEQTYQALYRLDPDSWYVHRALGESLSASGQPEKAIAEYEAAIRKQPNNPDLYESLGDEDQKVSRFEQATEAYQQELKLSPENGIALYNLGKIQVETGDPLAGTALLRRAAKAHAGAAPTYFYLGLGLSKLGQNKEAVESLERSLAAEPSDFIKQSAYYELVRVYQKLNRKEDSLRALEELKRLKAEAARGISNHQ
jgi:tetratricopeptide (TPR) repeat protein